MIWHNRTAWRTPWFCALLAAVVATAPGCSGVFADRDEPAAETLPASIARHEALARRVHGSSADLVLIGDSIVEAWPADQLAPHSVLNLGVGGDTTQNVLWRLEQYDLAGIHPAWALVLIGTNNLGHDAPADIAGQIERILRNLHLRLPRTRLAVMPVLPRGPAVKPYGPEIAAVNADVAGWARANGVTMLNVDPAHALSCDGYIPTCANYRPDQLHLRPSGYAVLSEAVKRAIDAG